MISLLLALACVPVDAPKLLARHLAQAVPVFAEVDPNVEIGYAPVPGAVRVFHADQLQSLAVRHKLALPATVGDVCFEWPTRALDPEELLASMRKRLPPDASVNLLDHSRALAPAGEIVFEPENLSGAMWRGTVRYGQGASFDIWARVEIKVKQTRVSPVSAVAAGQVLRAEDLRVEEIEGAPQTGLVTDLEDAVGFVAKTRLVPGTALRSALLEKPAVVKRGDLLRLFAVVGRAQVATSASAQAHGHIGDVIPVKNIATGRLMRARIEAAGEARIAQ